MRYIQLFDNYNVDESTYSSMSRNNIIEFHKEHKHEFISTQEANDILKLFNHTDKSKPYMKVGMGGNMSKTKLDINLQLLGEPTPDWKNSANEKCSAEYTWWDNSGAGNGKAWGVSLLFTVDKYTDDWYILHRFDKSLKFGQSTEFKCDQWVGLLDCIKKEFESYLV